MSNVHTVVVDFDGTCVTMAWPEMGSWLTGAVDALHTLSDQGYHLVVDSARLSRYDPHTGERRTPQEVLDTYTAMRALFDDAGLRFVQIWMAAGKPGAVAYIDDRAIFFPGGTTSWPKMVEMVGVRAKGQALWARRPSIRPEEWVL